MAFKLKFHKEKHSLKPTSLEDNVPLTDPVYNCVLTPSSPINLQTPSCLMCYNAAHNAYTEPSYVPKQTDTSYYPHQIRTTLPDDRNLLLTQSIRHDQLKHHETPVQNNDYPEDLRLPSSRRFYESSVSSRERRVSGEDATRTNLHNGFLQYVSHPRIIYTRTDVIGNTPSLHYSHPQMHKSVQPSNHTQRPLMLSQTYRPMLTSSPAKLIIPKEEKTNSEASNNNSSSTTRYTNYCENDSLEGSSHHAVSALDKSVPWMRDVTSPVTTTTHWQTHKDHDQHKVEKQKGEKIDYNRKHIENWSFVDVAHFLIDAYKYLNIEYDQVNFAEISNKDGHTLLQMTVEDFEKFAPNHGFVLYEHFLSFKNRNYVNNIPTSCIPQTSLPNTNQNLQYFGENEALHQISNIPVNLGDNFSSCYIPQGYTQSAPSDTNCQINDYIPSPIYSEQLKEPKKKVKKTVEPCPVAENDILLPDKPKKRGPGRPPKPENLKKRREKKTGRLWEFIRNLLLDQSTCPSLVRWENHEEGIFRFMQSEKIAEMWGMRKNNTKMNYEKLSRAMRYYYKGQIFEPVLGKRLVYKFGPRAKGWRPQNPNLYNRNKSSSSQADTTNYHQSMSSVQY